MVKSSILFALLMGLIFAQMIPAHSSDSDSETDNSDEESSNDRENADADEGEDEDEDESDGDDPALTCLLFGNLGCNTECATVASAFSIKGTGECVEENICQCTLEQDESLEGLFRAKFNADNALNKIKQDKKLAAQVLEILQVPFQTIHQTKRKLTKVVYPAIYVDLLINDKTPAWKLGLVGETDELDYDKIKKYVSDELTSVLKSSSAQLAKVNYTFNMKKSLEGKSGKYDDLHSIIDQVRRTKNKNLNDIINNYLKSFEIKEKNNTNKDDIADAIRYQVVDQFVNYIEQKKKPVAKKPARKPSNKKTDKKSKPAEKKSPKEEKSRTSKSSGNKDAKKKSDVSSSSRFELPGFDKDFLDDYAGSINETFKTKQYTLHYTRSSGGSIDFDWKKGNDAVNMSISSGNSINQTWRLGDVKITLDRSSGGSTNQTWDFGKTKYTYSKSSGGSISRNWANGKKDPENLKKYQTLIDEWCDNNDFLLVKNNYSSTKIPCTIY